VKSNICFASTAGTQVIMVLCNFRQQPVSCVHYIVGAALQAVMDFIQILVTSGNSEVDFHSLFEVIITALHACSLTVSLRLYSYVCK